MLKKFLPFIIFLLNIPVLAQDCLIPSTFYNKWQTKLVRNNSNHYTRSSKEGLLRILVALMVFDRYGCGNCA
jgi:hypothetical protein